MLYRESKSAGSCGHFTIPHEAGHDRNIRHGFIYERVPHITLKSIALATRTLSAGQEAEVVMSICTDEKRWVLHLGALAVLVSMGPRAAERTVTENKIPDTVVEALGCVLEVHGAALIGFLPPSRIVMFKYVFGPITGTSPPSPEGAVNLLIYAKSRRKVFLFTAIPGNGAWDVTDDYFVLDRAGQDWNVVDGNGGQATYAAVAAFVKKQDGVRYNATRPLVLKRCGRSGG